jgi:hypothetical protein
MKSKAKYIKQFLIVLALMTGALMLISAAPMAFAANFGLTPDQNPVAEETGGATSLRALILKMVNYFLTFLGILAVIMIIYGGVRYVASAGDDEAVGTAKKVILYAIIGLIIVLLSFVIINAILGAGLNQEPQ